MTESTKTWLIVGAVAVGAYLLYKKFTSPGPLFGKPTGLVNQPNGQTTSTTTQQGGLVNDFWSTLGNVGKGLNQATSSAESSLNSIYDLFGGQPTTGTTSTANAPTGP